MAIFYLHHDFKGRSNVRSIVAAAAYRSGDTLTDERTGRVHNYSRQGWHSSRGNRGPERRASVGVDPVRTLEQT